MEIPTSVLAGVDQFTARLKHDLEPEGVATVTAADLVELVAVVMDSMADGWGELRDEGHHATFTFDDIHGYLQTHAAVWHEAHRQLHRSQ